MLSTRKRIVCPPARTDNVIKCKQRWRRRAALVAIATLLGAASKSVAYCEARLHFQLSRHEKKNNLIKFRRRKRPRNVAIERTGAPMDPSILPIFASGADFCCVTVCVCACVCLCVCACLCVDFIRPSSAARQLFA